MTHGSAYFPILSWSLAGEKGTQAKGLRVGTGQPGCQLGPPRKAARPHIIYCSLLSISKTQQQLCVQLEFPRQEENPEAVALRWDPAPGTPRQVLVLGRLQGYF